MSTYTNDRGNKVETRHSIHGDRYAYDFEVCTPSEGWEQFDTWQDAWYFGMWVNKQKLMTVTYAEGDEITVTCPDAAHFNAEIQNACEFYEEGFEFIAYEGQIGHMTRTVYRQDRTQFFIKE